MSDYIVKIIPKDSQYCVSEYRMNDILRYLKNTIAAEYIDENLYETPQFIDCGSNLEKIYCPVCSKVIYNASMEIENIRSTHYEINTLCRFAPGFQFLHPFYRGTGKRAEYGIIKQFSEIG